MIVLHTGVFLPIDKLAEAKRLMEPVISMDLDPSITITTYPGKGDARKVIDDFAVESGLPRLSDGEHYGLNSDRELLAPPPTAAPDTGESHEPT